MSIWLLGHCDKSLLVRSLVACGHLSVKVLYHQNVDAFFLSSNKPIPQVGPVVARWED